MTAKIKGAGYITSDFLLNANFGTAPLPETTLSAKRLHQLSNALYYQLNERVTFVQPKDAIVAQLYFDLGNIAFLSANFTDALANYERAIEYGRSGQLIVQRIAAAQERSQNAKAPNNGKGGEAQKNDFRTFRIDITAALLLISLAIVIYRRARKHKV